MLFRQMTRDLIRVELENWVKELADVHGSEPFSRSPEWRMHIPADPGVYTLFEDGKLVYVGESGSLRNRMKDLTDTRNHTLRRKLGARLGSGGSSKKKFSEAVERKLNSFMEQHLRVKFLVVHLGRKEIEEAVVRGRPHLYNAKGRRGESSP